MYIYIRVCTYIYIYTCIHIYIYIYMRVLCNVTKKSVMYTSLQASFSASFNHTAVCFQPIERNFFPLNSATNLSSVFMFAPPPFPPVQC